MVFSYGQRWKVGSFAPLWLGVLGTSRRSSRNSGYRQKWHPFLRGEGRGHGYGFRVRL